MSQLSRIFRYVHLTLFSLTLIGVFLNIRIEHPDKAGLCVSSIMGYGVVLINIESFVSTPQDKWVLSVLGVIAVCIGFALFIQMGWNESFCSK